MLCAFRSGGSLLTLIQVGRHNASINCFHTQILHAAIVYQWTALLPTTATGHLQTDFHLRHVVRARPSWIRRTEQAHNGPVERDSDMSWSAVGRHDYTSALHDGFGEPQRQRFGAPHALHARMIDPRSHCVCGFFLTGPAMQQHLPMMIVNDSPGQLFDVVRRPHLGRSPNTTGIEHDCRARSIAATASLTVSPWTTRCMRPPKDRRAVTPSSGCAVTNALPGSTISAYVFAYASGLALNASLSNEAGTTNELYRSGFSPVLSAS